MQKSFDYMVNIKTVRHIESIRVLSCHILA
jgi:hypothetical protein